MTETRTPTAVDAVAEAFLEQHAALDPIDATFLGLTGHDDELQDFSPDWWQRMSDNRRRTLAALDEVLPVDSTDRITVAALRDDLELREQLRAAGDNESFLGVIFSPLQLIRDTFDLNPTDTVDHWAIIATRLKAVPAAVAGYISSLRYAAERGSVAAKRQIRAGVGQCNDNVGPTGFWAKFVADPTTAGGGELPASLRADLDAGAERAAAAYEELASFLGDELLPQGRDADAVGRDRYALHLQSWIGTRVDLDETYEWGQQELARITAEMTQTADRIKPGASVEEAIGYLNASPAHVLHGTDALQAWMQKTSDAAVAALADTHFDIPEPIRRLECRIAPTQQGGIYYTAPSEDFVTRPGRMWWSVPKGVTEFAAWRELTTVYHEGVPGHHLQIAQTAYRREVLNRWRRQASWVSGHGEGWALYAERLMADLGFLDDPANYLGMLDGQSMRAARVVLDVGIHCELPAPAEVGGGRWTYDKAWEFFSAHVHMNEGFRRFELARYLGWPGQAPSYKIGERSWLQLRDEVRAREGDAFDLKAFHRRALDIGSVGLDVLRAAVLGEI
jgi:uncharacterized protein (DUF885 family)